MMDGMFMPGVRMTQTHESLNASLARGDAMDAKFTANAVQMDVERLYLITEALWSIVKHELGYTDEMLAKVVEKIDGADGKVDGRKQKAANPNCPACDRTLIGQHPVCLYCGAQVTRDVFER